MKILHIIPTMSCGGAEKIALGLAAQAAREGHEANILSIMPHNDYEKHMDEAGVGFHTLSYQGGLGLGDLPAIGKGRKQLEEYIKSWQPDLIHSHLFISKLFLLGLKRAKKIPVVHTQHDNSPWWNKPGWANKTKTFLESQFQNQIARYTICISDSVKEDVQKISDPEAANNCVTIHNFIDLPVDRPAINMISGNDINLMMLCRLTMEKKGIDLGVKILNTLRKSSLAARLILVGKGDDEGKIRELVSQFGLDNFVDFRGYREDIYNQYRDADIVLMPSRWEGFGLSAAEAAAAGKPVIASRVGGLPEVVLDGETGFLCESEEVDQFSSSILSLVGDSALYERISSQAQLQAYDRFHIHKAFEKHERVYHKALSGELTPA